MPLKQAKNIINALGFAESLLPGAQWAHVVMVLDQSAYGVADPRAYMALQTRIFRAMRDWLKGQNLAAHWIWVREIGPRYGQQHTHVLLPLASDQREGLEDLIRRVGKLHDTANNRAVFIRLTGRFGHDTPAAHAGVLRDFLKSMSPKAKLNGSPIMPALATDNRNQPPCTILGKRTGTSESLNRKARAAAGWKERETPAELRTLLPTREDARKDRSRRAAARRRAERPSRHRIPKSKPPLPARAADPFEGDDLAADFFDG